MKYTIDWQNIPEFNDYIVDTFDNPDDYCEYQHKLVKYLVNHIFQYDGVYFEPNYPADCFKFEKYFPFNLVPWQKFALALEHGIRDKETGHKFFSKIFIMVGRGAGKNGMVSLNSMYELSELFPSELPYPIDIVANSRQQSLTCLKKDIVPFLLDNEKSELKINGKKMTYADFFRSRGWEYSLAKDVEYLYNRRTKSELKPLSSNAKVQDGRRPGKVVFDEVHALSNYGEATAVHTTGLNKIPNGTEYIISSNGNIRDGAIDTLLKQSDTVLLGNKRMVNGKMEYSRMLPIIYKLDNEEEVNDFSKWVKANPSFKHPSFKPMYDAIIREWLDFEGIDISGMIEFKTKRLGLSLIKQVGEVAPWEKVVAMTQNFERPAKGSKCIVSIDFAKVHDFAVVGAMFKEDDIYKFIHKTYIPKTAIESTAFSNVVAEAIETGYATVVDQVTEELIASHVKDLINEFNVQLIVSDEYLFKFLTDAFKKYDIDTTKFITFNSYRAQSEVFFDVTTAIQQEKVLVGDIPMFRWYTNNVNVITNKSGYNKFSKIDENSRKTDGFMALVHAFIGDKKYDVFKKRIIVSDELLLALNS